jgi:hypothetical protein
LEIDTLVRIDKLMKSLKTPATEQEREEWWSDFVFIKYDLEQDKRADKYERDTVYRVERTLSQFMAQIRTAYRLQTRAAFKSSSTHSEHRLRSARQE